MASVHSSCASLAFSAVCWKSQLAHLKDISNSAYLELNLPFWSCLAFIVQLNFPKYLFRAARRDIIGKNLDVGKEMGQLNSSFSLSWCVLSPSLMFRLPLLFSYSITIASELVLPLVFPLYVPLHSAQNCQRMLLRLTLIAMLIAILCSSLHSF